tara:strand:+ start:1624 stop:1977 length:354 start_codon:yes stop_codon:yes gene_type:complete
MLSIAGINYVFDFKNIDKLLSFDNSPTTAVTEVKIKEVYDDKNKLKHKIILTKTHNKPKEIDLTTYEIMKVLIEILLSYNDDFDDALGIDRALNSTPLPFKISFNTLIEYGIIKEIE